MKTAEKLLVRALKGETLERPPIWLMRQAGRALSVRLGATISSDTAADPAPSSD